jgi:hypothetical protein
MQSKKKMVRGGARPEKANTIAKIRVLKTRPFLVQLE